MCVYVWLGIYYLTEVLMKPVDSIQYAGTESRGVCELSHVEGRMLEGLDLRSSARATVSLTTNSSLLLPSFSSYTESMR